MDFKAWLSQVSLVPLHNNISHLNLLHSDPAKKFHPLHIHHPFPTFNPHSHGLGHFRQRFLRCRLKKIYSSHCGIKFSRDAWEKIGGRRNRGRDRDREWMKIDRCIIFVSWYIASKNSTFPEYLTINNWWK